MGSVTAAIHLPDIATWRAELDIDKWDAEQAEWVRGRTGLLEPKAADFEALGVIPYQSIHTPGNLLTSAGLAYIWGRVTGTGTALGNLTARIGVGDGSTTATVGDTDLAAASGSTHRWFQVMDATFPTFALGVLTMKSTFGSADGNFTWAEWGSDVAAATVTSGNTVNATLINRKVQSQGAKVSLQVWAATATITLS